MDRFYRFANWTYQNWVPIIAVPLLLLGLGVLTYQYVTEKPYEERMADRLLALRTSRELVDELKDLPLSDATRTIELGEWTSGKGYVLVTGEYETTQPHDEFVKTYSSALLRKKWEFVSKKFDRSLESLIFCRAGIQFDLTFHPAGILSSTDRGTWKIFVTKPHDVLPESCFRDLTLSSSAS